MVEGSVVDVVDVVDVADVAKEVPNEVVEEKGFALDPVEAKLLWLPDSSSSANANQSTWPHNHTRPKQSMAKQ